MAQPQPPNAVYTSPSAMNLNEKPTAQDDLSKKPQQQNKNWSFGLFDCFSPLDVCCLTCWCPCYVFGKTHKRNTTGEKDPSGFSGMCCAYAATLYCGCAPILQCMQRGNTRDKYAIDGGCFGDFCTSCCCASCALVQEEKESVVRVEGVDPKTGVAYQYQPVPVQGMNYS